MSPKVMGSGAASTTEMSIGVATEVSVESIQARPGPMRCGQPWSPAQVACPSMALTVQKPPSPRPLCARRSPADMPWSP